MEKSLVFVVITIGAIVSVNSLQCYTCEDCPTSALKDTDLRTCGVAETTTSTVASTAASVNLSTAASTAPPVDPSTAASTAASVNPTTAASTAASVIPSTAPSTAGPVDTSSAASTAASVSPSTAASNATSVNPSTAASTAAPVDTTSAASTAASIKPSTTASTAAFVRPSTAASTAAFVDSDFDEAESDADGTNYEKEVSKPSKPQVFRVRRNVPPETELDRGCTCYGTRCVCDKEDAVLKATQDAEVTYVCAKAVVKVDRVRLVNDVVIGLNGTDIIIRGCSQPQTGNKTVCEYLQQQANATDCHTCTTDKCNGAYTVQSSMAILLFVVTSVITINKK